MHTGLPYLTLSFYLTSGVLHGGFGPGVIPDVGSAS